MVVKYLVTKGIKAVVKKSGKAITKAGDEWHAKTQQLQSSKKKIEKIRGAARIGVPMTVAVGAGAALGVHDAKKEIQKRGVYGVERKDVGPKSIYKDIKKVIKKVKGK